MAKKQVNPIDSITAKALRSGLRLSREAVRVIMSLFGGNPRAALRTPEFREGVLGVLRETGDEVGDILFGSALAGSLQGGAGVIRGALEGARGPIAPLPPFSINPPDVQGFLFGLGERPAIDFPIIREAADILQGLNVMSPQDFRALGVGMRSNAFTVSGGLTNRSIQHVLEVLQTNFAKTTDRKQFLKDVREGIETMPLGEGHLEQVFRNNVNAAFSDGTEKVLEEQFAKGMFPFRAYFPIRDNRARPEHRTLEFLGLSGTNVYWGEDPVWEMFRPPWSFNCRCGFIPQTIRQAARRGVVVAQRWLETGVAPTRKQLTVPFPPFRPPVGWQRIAA